MCAELIYFEGTLVYVPQAVVKEVEAKRGNKNESKSLLGKFDGLRVVVKYFYGTFPPTSFSSNTIMLSSWVVL